MCAEALTPAWLGEALAPLLGASRVLEVACTPVGTGQMSDCVRLTPTYDRPTPAPRSMIAKLPAADPTSRATAGALRNYEIEVNFYRQLAPGLPVRAPRCYHAYVDDTATDFVLLLEDVAPARQGDQLSGCTVEQAAVAVEELPRLHAPRWGDASLAELDWLHRNPEESAAFTSQLVAGLFAGFCDRYSERIDADIMALGERLMARLPTYLGDRRGPWTVAHGDFRLDNLLFGTEPDDPAVVVVDWQTVTHGPGVSDLSYFLGAGLLPETRRSHERDLVRSYHDALTAAGVVGLDWNECWTQYRRYTFSGLIMAIAASMLVEQTDRGDEMFVTMAQRHGRHAIDLEAERLIG
ncbi:MAG TPA: phosphotransferase [Acidimicrobiales bacterium]|nr:phosphotransferase [Acidimicrobiales bacterium]